MSTHFTKDHEWVRLEGDVAIVGITDYAQAALGDIVFVDLPESGRALTQGKEAAVVESVKAASDIYAPISGEVVAVNDNAKNDPSLVNSSPQDNGWLFKIKPANLAELDNLMDESAYKKLTDA
jgi:glycine cleavage system H protein